MLLFRKRDYMGEKTNYELAKARADEIDTQIIDTLKSGKSFRVEAGAGSGKTYSLYKVVEWIDNNKAKEFNRKDRQVACITYTNTAVDVIKSRISSGSSIKICLVAEGKADVYPRFAPTMEWDTAAGHAIARAAGMEVYQAGKEEPLRYNKEDLLNPWFIVEPKREH